MSREELLVVTHWVSSKVWEVHKAKKDSRNRINLIDLGRVTAIIASQNIEEVEPLFNLR